MKKKLLVGWPGMRQSPGRTRGAGRHSGGLSCYGRRATDTRSTYSSHQPFVRLVAHPMPVR